MNEWMNEKGVQEKLKQWIRDGWMEKRSGKIKSKWEKEEGGDMNDGSNKQIKDLIMEGGMKSRKKEGIGMNG